MGGHVASQQAHLRELLLDFTNGFEHTRGVAVGRIDGEHIDARSHQLRRTLKEVAGGADGSADAQAALLILAGGGILELLLDVLDGD